MARRRLPGVRGQVGEQLARARGRLAVVVDHQLAHAVALVHARSAEVGAAHLLAHDLADHARAREEHARLARHHDEIGERGGVGASARRRAGDDRDLRHATGQGHVLAEDPSVAAQRGQPLLHPGACGLDEADHGHTGLSGQPQDADDGVGVGLAERAARERAVLGVAEHRPAVDAPGGADDAVPRPRLRAHPPRGDLGADDLERAGIAQGAKALQRGQGGALGVGLARGDRPPRDRNAHESTARASTALWPPNPNEFEIPTRRPSPLDGRSARASPGT